MKNERFLNTFYNLIQKKEDKLWLKFFLYHYYSQNFINRHRICDLYIIVHLEKFKLKSFNAEIINSCVIFKTKKYV